jgi:hypothetical protein
VLSAACPAAAPGKGSRGFRLASEYRRRFAHTAWVTGDEVAEPKGAGGDLGALATHPVASVKIRTGPGDDDSADAGLDVWAGVLPVLTGYGTPEPSLGLRSGIRIPQSVQKLVERSADSLERRHDGGVGA